MLRHCLKKHHYYVQINTKLIPAKIVGFVHYFGILAMYSYSTIHAKSLGLSASQIGVILAILPIAILFGPPVFCPLADKLQQHRWFLVAFLLLAGTFFMALILIPNIPQPQFNSTITASNETVAECANKTDATLLLPSSLSDLKVIETFALYAVVRTIAQMCDYIGAALLDSINFDLIEKHSVPKSGIGINRFWQTAGAALGPPFAGFFIDFFSTKYGERTYVPGFVTNACAGLVCASIVSLMEVPKDVKTDSMIKNIRVLFRHPPFAAFLIAVTLLGCNFGFIESFGFLYFDELGASSLLMGLTTTTAYVSALPLLFFSKWLFARIGHIVVIIFAFFTYATRYIGYSFVPSMGYIFIFEVLEAVTQNLMYTAATEYGFAATPAGMSATVQGFIHMSHWAIGKGIGNLIGGISWDALGSRRSFRLWGIVNIFLGSTYLGLHWLWLRNIQTDKPDKPTTNFNLQAATGGNVQ